MDDEDIDAYRRECFQLRDEVKKLRKKLDLFESGNLMFSQDSGKVSRKVYDKNRMYHYIDYDSLEKCYKALGL